MNREQARLDVLLQDFREFFEWVYEVQLSPADISPINLLSFRNIEQLDALGLNADESGPRLLKYVAHLHSLVRGVAPIARDALRVEAKAHLATEFSRAELNDATSALTLVYSAISRLRPETMDMPTIDVTLLDPTDPRRLLMHRYELNREAAEVRRRYKGREAVMQAFRELFEWAYEIHFSPADVSAIDQQLISELSNAVDTDQLGELIGGSVQVHHFLMGVEPTYADAIRVLAKNQLDLAISRPASSRAARICARVRGAIETQRPGATGVAEIVSAEPAAAGALPAEVFDLDELKAHYAHLKAMRLESMVMARPMSPAQRHRDLMKIIDKIR